MPFNIGAPEVILVLVVALLVLGPKRLPEVGSALGKTIREFRQAVNEAQDSPAGSAPTPAPPASSPSATEAPPESGSAPAAAAPDAAASPPRDHGAAA
ncbi:MAG TPA: twin-arginine translocase TatA/TatE family subunit [Candidatus Limnocylindrales bacterium]|nr:twin-arginine translocase TatA/TatE family subunit [Candidatus Limnocylindrales bacterium]